MPEPSTNEILTGLLHKIDSLDLQGAERALMWGILAAARDSIRVVDPGQGMSFQHEFADAFTPGQVDPNAIDAPHAAQFHSLMIVK